MQLQVLHIHELIFSPPFNTENSSDSETDTSFSVPQQLFSSSAQGSAFPQQESKFPQHPGSIFSAEFLLSSSKTSLSDCSAAFSGISDFAGTEEHRDSGVRARFGLGALLKSLLTFARYTNLFSRGSRVSKRKQNIEYSIYEYSICRKNEEIFSHFSSIRPLSLISDIS